MTPGDSAILERVHIIETAHARHDVRIEKLEDWVRDIHRSVKGLEKKASVLIGALVFIELALKFWK